MNNYSVYIQRLIQRLRLEPLFEKDRKTKEAVEILYRCRDQKKVWEKIWCQRVLWILIAGGVSVLFFLGCYMEEKAPDVIRDGCIIKNGEETVTFRIRARAPDGMAEEDVTVDLQTEQEEDQDITESSAVSQSRILLDEIRQQIEQMVEEQKEADQIRLPVEVSGTQVEYLNIENKKDYSAFFLSLFVLVTLPFLWRRQRQEKLRQREEELMLDYPEVVNKIMLLLRAGLAIRSCFERICKEYHERLETGAKRRYVYEEMTLTCQEMKHGVSEGEAIESFAKRCGQLPYLKFASLINQNIRKGSSELIMLLGTESMEAFEKRKEMVKKMGETAGTKLLLPMVMMLGVVVVIIIVPAFMNM